MMALDRPKYWRKKKKLVDLWRVLGSQRPLVENAVGMDFNLGEILKKYHFVANRMKLYSHPYFSLSFSYLLADSLSLSLFSLSLFSLSVCLSVCLSLSLSLSLSHTHTHTLIHSPLCHKLQTKPQHTELRFLDRRNLLVNRNETRRCWTMASPTNHCMGPSLRES